MYLETCFPRGGRKLNLHGLPYHVPKPCHHTDSFCHPRGWRATLSLHPDWPCVGLLCHSWCSSAPAESSSKWPRLHLVRLDYIVKSCPLFLHLCRSWSSSAPTKSSAKWSRLHLAQLDYIVNSCWIHSCAERGPPLKSQSSIKGGSAASPAVKKSSTK